MEKSIRLISERRREGIRDKEDRQRWIPLVISFPRVLEEEEEGRGEEIIEQSMPCPRHSGNLVQFRSWVAWRARRQIII